MNLSDSQGRSLGSLLTGSSSFHVSEDGASKLLVSNLEIGKKLTKLH